MSNWKAGLVAVVSAAALVGCTRSLNMEQVKTTVGDMVHKQVGANVKGVSCPESREMKAGDTFDCTVEIDHGKTIVRVVQQDDQGNLDLKTPQLIVKVGELEKMLVNNVQQRNPGVQATVDCGPKFRPSVPKDTFDCTMKAADQTIKYKVVIKDEQGNVDVEPVADPAAPAAPVEDQEAAE